jgi:hypothetical protein
MEDVGIFYGYLVYFVAFLYMLWSFGICCCHLVYFSHFGLLYPEKSCNPEVICGQVLLNLFLSNLNIGWHQKWKREICWRSTLCIIFMSIHSSVFNDMQSHTLAHSLSSHRKPRRGTPTIKHQVAKPPRPHAMLQASFALKWFGRYDFNFDNLSLIMQFQFQWCDFNFNYAISIMRFQFQW